MLSSAATAPLRDIAHHIGLAAQFTAGFDYEAFVADPRTVYAVTRCLEIISEASRRLPDDLKARHPAIAWKDMAGAGNIYRHDYEAFVADPRTVYAVTRCLEIISEASRRLPDDLKARHPSIAWKDMAGAGNIYRHDYEDVAAQHVWDAVQIDLPPLRVVIERELAAFEPPPDGAR